MIGSKHTLSDADHQIIRREHKEDLVDTIPPSEAPKIIILAGQPGAGKGGLSAQASRDFSGEQTVLVDVDQLRNSHPHYRGLKSENDRTAAGLVQPDAGQWGDELVEDARLGRRNIILDGTLKSPDKADELCKRFKEDGYQVEVRVIAVREEDSWLGVHQRYERGRTTSQGARWVPKNVHDGAYSGGRQSLERLNQSPHVDRIEVHGRAFDSSRTTRVLYNGAPGEGDPVAALDTERNRPRTLEEAQWYRQETQRIAELKVKRDPMLNAPEDQDFVRRAELLQQDQLSSNKKKPTSMREQWDAAEKKKANRSLTKGFNRKANW